jgi:phosphate transport system substrate-binding protein
VPDPEASDSYPIVTLTWILLYRNYPDERKVEALQALFRWCLTDGQRIAKVSLKALDAIHTAR